MFLEESLVLGDGVKSARVFRDYENRGIDSNRCSPDFALHFDGANQLLFLCSSKGKETD